MRKKILKLAVISALTTLFCNSVIAAQVSYGKFAFRDEFNKANNAPIDSSKWTAEIGGSGWGNQELQYYINSVENAYHNGNGSLIIKAIKLTAPLNLNCRYGQCQYTSARLITKRKFDRKYGRFEARKKFRAVREYGRLSGCRATTLIRSAGRIAARLM